jgi:membrane protein required for beta-lactamase induction
MKAAYGWPASIFWAVVIYHFWGSGKVDMDLIVGLVR